VVKPEIRPGTCRDLCFTAANMRDEDRREINASAVLASMTEAAMLSWYSSGPDWCWTVWIDNQPQAAFGLSAMGHYQPHMRTAWAWGTVLFRRCVPAMTRHMMGWQDRILADGVQRIEIRSLKDHDLAHKWLSGIGAKRECEMLNYGTQGETFELWAFVRKDYDNGP
jgi:hypothetical protein